MEDDNSAMGTPAGDDTATTTEMPAEEMPAEGAEHTDEAM